MVNHCIHSLYFISQKRVTQPLYSSVGLVELLKIDLVHKLYPPKALHELSRLDTGVCVGGDLLNFKFWLWLN